jgi:hypothetical protein
MNILVTNFQDSGEDVMVFTRKATATDIEKRLNEKGAQFNECYSVKDEELGYYIYDPLHLTEKEEKTILEN